MIPATKSIPFNPICLKPNFMPSLLDAMANGDLLIDVCTRMNVKYSDVMGYIMADTDRKLAWNAAVKDGQSHLVNTLISELKAMRGFNIKDALNSDGTVRRIEDIPEALQKAITSIEVREVFDEEGKLTGFIKTIKLADKHKSIDMLGKQLNMFIDKIVVSGAVDVRHTVDPMDLEAIIKQLESGKQPPLEAVAEIAEVRVNKPGDDI
jgi:hypothetical protein